MSSDSPFDEDFLRKRAALMERIGRLTGDKGLDDDADRDSFFEAVYETAGDDPANIPWADLKPKNKLVGWLAENPGDGRSAIDIACGLGDNAEAIAAAGYRTVAFDLSERAIDWARRRFSASKVDYTVANLLEHPPQWAGAFDLVHECFTVQSVPPPLHERFSRAVAELVKPGGLLLVYARMRPEGSEPDGPPWPLMPSETGIFARLGFDLISEDHFETKRPDRTIPLVFMVWKKRGLTGK